MLSNKLIENHYRYFAEDYSDTIYSFTANELGEQSSNFKTNNKMKQILSEQFSLGWRDLFKGLVMAVLTPVVLIVQQSLSAGEVTFNWTAIGIAALSGAVAYLVKNFLEPTTVIETKPSQAKVDSLKQ